MAQEAVSSITRPLHLVIIGAGATGVSLFVQLIRAGLEGTESVTLIDPHPPGRGLAFGDPDPMLLCNTSAGIQSVISGRPSDFLDYCRARGLPVGPEDFVPRAWMGDYCADRFREHAASAARQGVGVQHVAEKAVAIAPAENGYRIELANGEHLQCSRGAVCTGLSRPRVPDGFARYAGHPRLAVMPYPLAHLRARVGAAGSRVLLVGAGPSALDATLALCQDGHQVTMASRSGLLPAVRARFLYDPRPAGTLSRIRSLSVDDPDLHRRLAVVLAAAVRDIAPLPLRDQVSQATDPVQRLREETELAACGHCHWQDAVHALVDVAMDWTAGLHRRTRDALMAPYGKLPWRYITSLALPNAQHLLKYLDSGLLRLETYDPRSVRTAGKGFEVSGSRYDHIVGAAGFFLPTVFREHSRIHLDGSPSGAAPMTSLAPDLCVQPPGVWLTGVTTHVRIPFANFLPSSVRQAQHVARQMTSP